MKIFILIYSLLMVLLFLTSTKTQAAEVGGSNKPESVGKPGKKTDPKAKKMASCTADGHGPYDLTYSKCMQLGADQAHTNCVLKAKDAKVELVFATVKIKKTATCYAKVKSGSEDCEPAQCYGGNDTAQH